MTITLREEVKKFSNSMECVLLRNDYKGGWHDSDIALRFSVDTLILEDAYDQNFYL